MIVTTVVHRPVPSSPGCRIVVIFELRYLRMVTGVPEHSPAVPILIQGGAPCY